MPTEQPKTEDEKKAEDEDKKDDCDKCKAEKCDDCVDQKQDKNDDKKPMAGRKLRRPRKNRKAVNKPEQGKCFFPMSMSMLYGPLGDPGAEASPPAFPYNVTFKQVSFTNIYKIFHMISDSKIGCELVVCRDTNKITLSLSKMFGGQVGSV